MNNTDTKRDGKKHLVGLCIVYKNRNYGSMLQSFATLVKLEELGVDYEIIDYSHPQTLQFYASAAGRIANRDFLYSKARLLRKKAGLKFHPDYAANEAVRGERFDRFKRERFGHFSEHINEYIKLRRYAEKFTDVLVGSDQLWLPSGNGTNFYNLMFAPRACNKIAYAASFGVSSIPERQKEETAEYLRRIQHISLREEAGQRIVKELTGRDVPVILDPTMVLTRQQWDAAIPDKAVTEGEYLFCYFLGNNPSQREEVTALARVLGLKIVVLRHLDEYIAKDETFGDEAPYDVGPEEFVNLIRHAKYVCTDSFHGSVFSILYHKQFISFNRYGDGTNSRNSRLDTLFGNIGIDRRFHGDLENEIQREIDYDAVDSKLETLRCRSDRFIRDALSICAVPEEERGSSGCSAAE